MDIYKNDKYYEKKRLEIEQKWDMDKDDKKNFLKFLEKKQIEGISLAQLLKYILSMKNFLESYHKPFADITKEDLDGFIKYMFDKGLKSETRRTRWFAVKKFFEWLGNDIAINYKHGIRSERPPLPDILTEDEIERLVNACNTIRDRAMVGVLYESGMRVGELVTLKIKDVEFDNYGGILILNGKTGSRRIRIINSTPLLQNWIKNHPLKNDPESWIWVTNLSKKTGSGWNRLSYSTIRGLLKILQLKAGITKRVYPHLFRHSRATHLAKILTESQLKTYLGWTQRSRMAGTYVHLSGRDVDKTLLKAYGIKIGEETETDTILLQLNDMNIHFPFGKMGKLEILLLQFLKAIGEEFPQVKERFQQIVKQNKMEDLFK